MKEHPWIRVCWHAISVLLIVSFVAVLYSAMWEYSTRSYLKGFSDAIVPSTNNPEQKVEAILAWMSKGPERSISSDPDSLPTRDPEDTLNSQQLLAVCGTATNAFVNLGQSSGLHVRRLLLLNKERSSKHVVAEVLIGGRWIIVDPSYRFIPRLSDGQMLTRKELRDPAIFRAATKIIPNYPQSYTYERTAHVHLSRLPEIGGLLRSTLDFIWPSWEVSINWTLLLERESFAALVVSCFLFVFFLAARLLLGWYCSRRLGIARVRLRDRIWRAGHVLAGSFQ